jgi:hypothetical protein
MLASPSPARAYSRAVSVRVTKRCQADGNGHIQLRGPHELSREGVDVSNVAEVIETLDGPAAR